VTHGIRGSPMPGFEDRLSEEERWDLINFLRALAAAEGARWIGATSRFWYRKSVQGGHEFTRFDAETLEKRPAFDHRRLAPSLSAAALNPARASSQKLSTYVRNSPSPAWSTL